MFDANVGHPYLSGAAVLLVGFLISLVWVRQSERENPSAGPQPAAD